MKKNYILFDLDGTLTDPFEGITASFQYALSSFGIDVSQESLKPVIGPPLVDSFCSMFGFDEEKALMAVDKYRERYDKVGWRENILLEGVPDMLDNLKSDGRILALATSKPIVYAERILKEFDILKYFHKAVGPSLNGEKGTKLEVIKKAAEELGNPLKESMIMVGDRKYDIEGAKDFGIASVGVYTGYAKEGELEGAKPDYTVESISSLERLLLSI